MPTYQSVLSPLTLSPGDIGFSWNNEAFPAANTAGFQFAIPSFARQPDTGVSVRWQTIFGGAPTAMRIVLQGTRWPMLTPKHRAHPKKPLGTASYKIYYVN
jgi:hypothetical protein